MVHQTGSWRVPTAVLLISLAVVLDTRPGARDLPAYSPTAPAIEAVAVAVTGEAIRVDGLFSECSWEAATATADFQQREPAEGTPASHVTHVKVLFDRDVICVAVRAFDPEPDRVVGLLTRRDDQSPSDRISVLVDSYFDRRTAFEFGVNPAGVKFDRYWFNDTNNDWGWDAVWDAAVTRHADGCAACTSPKPNDGSSSCRTR